MLAEHKPLTSLLWNGKDLWQPVPPWMSVLVGLGNPYIPLSHVISGSSIIIKYVFQPFQHNLSNESLRQWWLQVFILSVQMSMAFCSTTTLEQILRLGSMLWIRCCQPSDAASFDFSLELRLQHSERLESCWAFCLAFHSTFSFWGMKNLAWHFLKSTEYREGEVKICQACKSGSLAVGKVYLLRQHVVRKNNSLVTQKGLLYGAQNLRVANTV